MVINHNMSALYSNRQLGVTNQGLQKDMEKLSSGERINRAGDDASGLAVSEKMRSQIRGLNQASQNAQNGISFNHYIRASCVSLQGCGGKENEIEGVRVKATPTMKKPQPD